jgi:hypothetical protein
MRARHLAEDQKIIAAHPELVMQNGTAARSLEPA